MRGIPQVLCCLTFVALYMRVGNRLHALLHRASHRWFPALRSFGHAPMVSIAGTVDDDDGVGDNSNEQSALASAARRERSNTLGACRLWSSRYGVEPGRSWGFLPPALVELWRMKRCTELIAGKRGCAGFDSREGLDQPGNDMFAGPLTVLSSGDCCVQCSRVPSCRAWTFNVPELDCWLKGRTLHNLPRETQESEAHVSGWRIEEAP